MPNLHPMTCARYEAPHSASATVSSREPGDVFDDG